MTQIIDFQAARAQRQAKRETAEIRRQGFATPSTTLQALAFSIANEDWAGLEDLLADGAED